MSKILFGLLFSLLFLKINAYSQTYRCQYRIRCDTSFVNNPNENGIGSHQEGIIQSFVMNSFFDSTLLDIVANRDKILETVFPKFLQKNKVLPGESIPRAAIVGRHSAAFSDDNGNNETVSLKIDSGAFDNQTLVDKRKKVEYWFQPYPKSHVTCQQVDIRYKFRKTSIKKRIGKWNCYKWLPTDKVIKNKVAIWVCDSIPSSVNLFYAGNNHFTGGVVCIDFARGFSYNLVSYSKMDDPHFAFPKYNTCDSTIATDDNFIGDLIYGKMGLDFKYK